MTTDAVKVSVSFITYNHSRYIRQALDSVLMQKLDGRIEIVVGDDCSTDGTREIVEEYARIHPGLIVPVLPERNLGDDGRLMFVETLRHCQGKYIAWLEGDDYWTSDTKLQQQTDYLDSHPECSLCYHDAIFVTDEGEGPVRHYMAPGTPEFVSTKDVILYCSIPGCSSMVRREVIEQLPPWFFDGPVADFPLYLIAAEKGSLGYIDAPLGAYREHSGGVWSGLSLENKLRIAISVLEAVDGPLGAKYGKTLAQAKSWQHIELATHLAKAGQLWNAMGHIATAIRLDWSLRRGRYLLARRLARRFHSIGRSA